MQTTSIMTKTLTALLLLGASVVSAAPTISDDVSNLTVLLRGKDSSYSPPPEKAESIKNVLREFGGASKLSKRSSATVYACQTSDCSSCTEVFDGYFSSSSQCINAANTFCLMISNLSDANVQYWSNSNCNGRHTSYGTCGGSATIGTPNTQSLAAQTGCL